MTCILQTQLDEDTSDASSSSDVGDDDDMPRLSPVTGVSVTPSIYPPSTIHASTVRQPCSIAEKSVGSKSTTSDVSDSQLHCICRTPYDQTKYVIASSCHVTSLLF